MLNPGSREKTLRRSLRCKVSGSTRNAKSAATVINGWVGAKTAEPTETRQKGKGELRF